MTNNVGNRFIPSFVFSAAVLAITAPYLVILIRDLGYSPLATGALLGTYNGVGIAGPILFGYLADKTGNYRSVLIISCILPILAVFPLILWVHPVISALALALMAFGIRSSVSLIDAITTIQIGRTGNYGRIRVWGSITFIVMMLWLQWTPFLKPNNAGNIGLWIIITATLSVVPILILPRVLLRTSAEHHVEKTGSAPGGNSSNDNLFRILSVYVIGGFAAIFLCNFSMSAVYTYFPLYLTEVLNWDMVGLMFALATISEVPIMFLSAAFIRRFGSLPLLTLAAAAITLRLLIWAFLPYIPWIIASQLLHSLCFGIFYPAAIHFIACIFPAKKRGTGMSVYMAVGSGLPSLIGSVAGGAIIEAAGYQALFIIYAAATALAVLICVVVRLKAKPDPQI